jgi:conjugal transfer pilus assembly protein TraA
MPQNLAQFLDRNRKVLMVTALFVFAMAYAYAGNGGTQFAQALTTVQGYAEGSLGAIIAITMLIVGLAIGIARQSVYAAVMGLSAAFVLYYGPSIIIGLDSATRGVGLFH